MIDILGTTPAHKNTCVNTPIKAGTAGRTSVTLKMSATSVSATNSPVHKEEEPATTLIKRGSTKSIVSSNKNESKPKEETSKLCK